MGVFGDQMLFLASTRCRIGKRCWNLETSSTVVESFRTKFTVFILSICQLSKNFRNPFELGFYFSRSYIKSNTEQSSEQVASKKSSNGQKSKSVTKSRINHAIKLQQWWVGIDEPFLRSRMLLLNLSKKYLETSRECKLSWTPGQLAFVLVELKAPAGWGAI